jgi:hypothetical protein
VLLRQVPPGRNSFLFWYFPFFWLNSRDLFGRMLSYLGSFLVEKAAKNFGTAKFDVNVETPTIDLKPNPNLTYLAITLHLRGHLAPAEGCQEGPHEFDILSFDIKSFLFQTHCVVCTF